jgi:hypothetical protein
MTGVVVDGELDGWPQPESTLWSQNKLKSKLAGNHY